MSAPSEYAVGREADGSFRLDRCTGPGSGPVAYARPVLDRGGAQLGWRLKPIRTVRGSASKIWPTAAEALASTALLTLGQAKAAVAAASATADLGGRQAGAAHA